jgi:hypothetical protein
VSSLTHFTCAGRGIDFVKYYPTEIYATGTSLVLDPYERRCTNLAAPVLAHGASAAHQADGESGAGHLTAVRKLKPVGRRAMKREKVGTDQLAALGLTVIVASLAVGLLAIGCGKQQSETVTTETGTIRAADAGKAPSMANAAASATGTEGTTPTAEADSTDAMPPDILAKTSADYVTAGEIVEITAQGTPDVVEVILKDGRGKTQPLVYDASAAAWRGRYRVPLQPATERLGLSVTAKNAQKLQHRVWVFLQIERIAAETAAPDSQ